MILKFKVSEQTISAVQSKSVPRIGSKDYLILQFSFSNDWEGLTKIAYLQRDSVSVPIEIKDGLVEVPEWFTEQESFNATLLGTDGTKEVPTNIVAIKLEKSNDLWVKDAPEPTPSWITKLIDLSDHPPIPGSNGFWLLWDTDRGEYVESQLPVSEGMGFATRDTAGIIKVGENLSISEDGVLSVVTTDTAQQDNTKPITSAGVYTLAGNIEVLLAAL